MNFAVIQKKKKKKRVDNIFKKLFVSNSISEETRRYFKPVGTKPVIIYGLCKVHKDIIDNCPLFDLFWWQLMFLPMN